MRADMDKVLVERPRHWRSHATLAKRAHRRTTSRLGEDAPSKEPICPYDDRKSFDDHLGPLRRFLSSNVGRPWSKVYSEICERITPSSTVQRHILGHVFGYVERDVVTIERGVPYVLGHRGLVALMSYRDSQFFVHPRSGLLLRAPIRVRKRPHELARDVGEKVAVHIVDDLVYARFNGLWFRPVLDDKPRDRIVVDVIGREIVRQKYASSKGKHLSSRELRALGLVNAR